jgi:pantoate--beta-alanine ligase
MITATTIPDLRAARRADPGLTWGLVPTMGALHAGHIALVNRARAECDRVGVSIFVNPAQFNNPDDLKKYPRTLERDLELLAAAGCDLVWTPTPEIMYPPGYQTYVSVEEVSQPLEGASRPGHFRGVATVVAKLFNVFQPTRAYFGQKDAQQVVVIRQMARDLNFNLEVVVCPTLREPDGLAMSSRNVRLTPDQRAASTVLYRALTAAEQAWHNDQRDADTLRDLIETLIATGPLARIDYISIADPDTLISISGQVDRGLISLAVYFGEVRLIDNVLVGEEKQ